MALATIYESMLDTLAKTFEASLTAHTAAN